MDYEYLSHTADVKIRAFGDDFAKACGNAARAFTDLLTDVQNIEPKLTRPVSVRASTKEALLYDFLNELVYRKDVDGFVPCEAALRLERDGNTWALRGELRGDLLGNHESSGDVKAATYHDMHIEEHRTMAVLEFVLDI